MKRALATLWISGLAGCGTPTWRACDGAQITAPDGTLVLAGPPGWVQSLRDEEAIWLTRDGEPLQVIRARSLPLGDLHPEERSAPDLPQLADELEAALRREAGSASLERISIEPTTLDGLDAVSLHVRATSRNAPSSDLLLVAAVAANRVYLVSYTARSLHFYERDLPAFELACRSFRRR